MLSCIDGEKVPLVISPSPPGVTTFWCARVPASVKPGDTVHVQIRDKQLPAAVVKLPFVRNGKVLAAV